ncbi:flagellin N-terminal helical domain-containing protein [Noviherbaspirillum aridicola]|uniref:Flagellin n=1 Tax=Noviherbaspirillum aridicola TaxID=2849687 RepID=A0ABQ4Q6M8_9BURK|nr:flagellin [Noviherbaspirillum aridicola]GIZ52697.1 B-type flagellin [Noviherbaspirillum aridicola]
MAAYINTNIASLNSQRNLNKSEGALSTSLQRLSSGLRINSAKDDAAGLAISQRMTAQINGMDVARRNANDGVSLAQTAESALGNAGDLLQRIRELAVQSSNASNSAGDRQSLNAEVGQLTQELERLANSTEFNGKKLFDGSFGSAQFQVGANAGQTITTNTANLRTSAYGNNQATTAAGAGVGSAVATSSAVTAGAVTVNGFAGSKDIAVGAGDSAKAVAAKVNQVTTDTGVTATARTDAKVSFSASGSYNLTIKGDNDTAETVSFSLSAFNTADGLSSAVTAFNDKSAKTGVTASLNSTGDAVILTSSTGADIVIADTAVANGGTTTVQGLKADGSTAVGDPAVLTVDTDVNTAYTTGLVTFDSEKSFSAVQADSGTNILGAIGAVTTNSKLNKVSEVDVSTFNKAQEAIKTIDSALNMINGERAKFGALQSRFASTITSLQTSSENLSAARSRIQDTDFAAETASLTRSQILQQAGTAMLAQANSLPNSVLSLLRG